MILRNPFGSLVLGPLFWDNISPWFPCMGRPSRKNQLPIAVISGNFDPPLLFLGGVTRTCKRVRSKLSHMSESPRNMALLPRCVCICASRGRVPMVSRGGSWWSDWLWSLSHGDPQKRCQTDSDWYGSVLYRYDQLLPHYLTSGLQLLISH